MQIPAMEWGEEFNSEIIVQKMPSKVWSPYLFRKMKILKLLAFTKEQLGK